MFFDVVAKGTAVGRDARSVVIGIVKFSVAH